MTKDDTPKDGGPAFPIPVGSAMMDGDNPAVAKTVVWNAAAPGMSSAITSRPMHLTCRGITRRCGNAIAVST